jgi:hypothetical protein
MQVKYISAFQDQLVNGLLMVKQRRPVKLKVQSLQKLCKASSVHRPNYVKLVLSIDLIM